MMVDGEMTPVSFAWRGRSLDHCLSSGLDDYPRASWIDPDEGHVDLHAWLTFACDTMSLLADWLVIYTRETTKASSYAKSDDTITLYTRYRDNYRARHGVLLSSLDRLHWDHTRGAYADYAEANGTRRFIHHTGYVTFMPLFLGIVPSTSDKLPSMLHMLHDPKHIWSPYGLLSLSRSDPLFGTKVIQDS
jgi:mannosyl-oligosaccharide glucosidase